MCLGIPGKLVEIIEEKSQWDRVGKVNFSGIVKKVNLAFVPEVSIGDYVIVHVGVAISRINENEAMKVLSMLSHCDESE